MMFWYRSFCVRPKRESQSRELHTSGSFQGVKVSTGRTGRLVGRSNVCADLLGRGVRVSDVWSKRSLGANKSNELPCHAGAHEVTDS